MAMGMSIMGLVISIIAGLVPIAVIITIVVLAIKGVKGRGGKVDDGEKAETSETTSTSDAKATAEEINQKIKNIFANLAENNNAQPAEKKESKKEVVKDRRCKNCGASLEEDKNGKLHCPYCQSKYF